MIRLLFKVMLYQYLGTLIEVLRYLLVKVFRSDPKEVQKLIDSINQDLVKDDRYNQFVIENEELLGIRIEAEVDKAIEDYTESLPDVTITPTYSEKESDDPSTRTSGWEMCLSHDFYTKEDEL